ncbi:cyclin-D1-binding protein 1-like protein [Tanacetum coccineum]
MSAPKAVVGKDRREEMEKEKLNMLLIKHLNTIHETFQVLDHSPPSTLTKGSWDDVIKLGEHLYKQATTALPPSFQASTSGVNERRHYTRRNASASTSRTSTSTTLYDESEEDSVDEDDIVVASLVGMLWTGDGPDAKALEETMETYSNLLQGFLLLSHGCMIGAGTTLSTCIHSAVKQVIDCSFMLLKESIASYGNSSKAHKLSIPQIVGTVWEACSALKKTPGTNVTAIGRAMTQIAVSIKDVHREMQELKPTSEEAAKPDNEVSKPGHDSDNSSEGDLGSDLSPEEMKIAELSTEVVSCTLTTIKEVIRSISGLLKNPQTQNESNQTVDSLEKLLAICQSMGLQVDEIGACLYPPQEVSAIRTASEKMLSLVGEMQAELEKIKGSSDAFIHSSKGLISSLEQLESALGCSSDDELVSEMENLAVDA